MPRAGRSLPGDQVLRGAQAPRPQPWHRTPGPRAAYLPRSGSRAPRPSLFLLLRLLRSSRLPRPSSEFRSSPALALIPGGGVPGPRVTPPSAVPGHLGQGEGTDGNGRPGRGGSGRGGEAGGGVSPGKTRDALSAGPRGSSGGASVPGGQFGAGGERGSLSRPRDRAGRRRFRSGILGSVDRVSYQPAGPWHLGLAWPLCPRRGPRRLLPGPAGRALEPKTQRLGWGPSPIRSGGPSGPSGFKPLPLPGNVPRSGSTSSRPPKARDQGGKRVR